MKKAGTVETNIFVVACPQCGAEFEYIMGDKGQIVCHSCQCRFGNIESPDWIEKKSEGVICDRCANIVVCTSPNFIISSKFKMVACPNCRSETGQHIIAVYHRGKWSPTEVFLHKKRTDGIRDVVSTRDKITLDVLNLLARGEKSDFRRVGDMRAKILWVEGNAVGYYIHSITPEGIPSIHQIFVVADWRRKGYGRLMTEDFINNHKGELIFEAPISEEYVRLMEKMGLIKRENGKLISTGRIRFIHGL